MRSLSSTKANSRKQRQKRRIHCQQKKVSTILLKYDRYFNTQQNQAACNCWMRRKDVINANCKVKCTWAARRAIYLMNLQLFLLFTAIEQEKKDGISKWCDASSSVNVRACMCVCLHHWSPYHTVHLTTNFRCEHEYVPVEKSPVWF